MRTLPTAAALTVSALVAGAIALGPMAAGASTSQGRKPPVKISGSVDDHGTGKVRHHTAEIDADDFYFDETFLKGKAGTTVGVTITNNGDVDHTFTVDAQDIDEVLAPGESVDVDVEVPENGKPAIFYCRFHQASGMQGALFSKSTKAGGGRSTKTTGGRSGGYGY